MFTHGIDDQGVTYNYDGKWCNEPEDVKKENKSSVVISSGQVVERARGLKPLRNIVSPAEDRRTGGNQRPQPYRHNHEECFLSGHGFSNL